MPLVIVVSRFFLLRVPGAPVFSKLLLSGRKWRKKDTFSKQENLLQALHVPDSDVFF